MKKFEPKRVGRLTAVEPHYTIQDVARAYGVGWQAVRKWIDQGLIPHFKVLPGNVLRIPQSALDEFDHLYSTKP